MLYLINSHSQNTAHRPGASPISRNLREMYIFSAHLISPKLWRMIPSNWYFTYLSMHVCGVGAWTCVTHARPYPWTTFKSQKTVFKALQVKVESYWLSSTSCLILNSLSTINNYPVYLLTWLMSIFPPRTNFLWGQTCQLCLLLYPQQHYVEHNVSTMLSTSKNWEHINE